MNKKELLLKVKLCPGIGLKGQSVVYEWLIKNDIISLSENELKTSLSDLLKRNHLNNENFDKYFDSDFLKKQVELNKQEKYITIFDDIYPPQLREIYQPPVVLFYRGNINLLKNNCYLGVVGSRKCTEYAFRAMKRTISKKVILNFVIVSGLAEGVDTLGHQISLANKGNTIAIIGTGLDISYPFANQYLQNQLMNEQLVLSEYGLGDKPKKFHFVERDRIIAGISNKLLVIEARKKSGSLITASLALRENRDVLAIPGDITNLFSAGTNELIAAGAKPCLLDKDIFGRIVI